MYLCSKTITTYYLELQYLELQGFALLLFKLCCMVTASEKQESDDNVLHIFT